MIITRTPFRVSFLGGGSDYPAHFLRHGGAVLGMAIDKYCYVSVRVLPPFFQHKYRIVYSQIELTRTIDEIEHPAVRAVLKAYWKDDWPGLEIHHDADLPARSGMGSSSSFVVGLIKAILKLRGIDVKPHELAVRAITLEQKDLGERVGCQDQIFAAHGGLALVRFKEDNSFTGQLVDCDTEALCRHVLLFYTGVQRIADQVLIKQMANLEHNSYGLNRMVELADMGVRALIKGNIYALALYLHEAWVLKRSFADDVSNQQVDQILAAGFEAGAWAGKLLGAGTGGFVMFLAPPERQDAICEVLRELTLVRVAVDRYGSRIVANGE